MPTTIKRLTPTALLDVDYTADTLKSAENHETSDGIYTVTITYNTTQTLMFSAHLDRLEDSARRENIPLFYDRARLKSTLRQMILDSGYGDVKFRITVPRETPDEMILTIAPFTPPTEAMIENGVRCITSHAGERHNPAAKTTEWIHTRKKLEADMPEGIYDTFLLKADGMILEGLGSNFYAIIDGELRTAGEGVLTGISQRIVFEIYKGIIPLRKDPVHVDDIPKLSDAFLTSSSRGIIPVIEIDGIIIGDGKRGEKTKQLRHAYDTWMANHLEEL
jgi:branched-chain amino acid aminotransferase